MPRTAGALAAKLDARNQAAPRRDQAVARPQPVAVLSADNPARKPAPKVAVQGWLFRDGAASNVISFEQYAAPRGPEAAPPRIRTRVEFGSKPPAPPRRATRVPEIQQSLEFLPAMPAKARTLGTTVEASIYSDEPVATLAHRAVAAALDWSMVLIAYGLFLGVFRLCGGEFHLTKLNLSIFACLFPLLGLAYGLIWTLAGSDTAGMKWAQLRLTTFEGFPPEMKHRVLRFAGSCLSKCAVVGLLWAFADEESLTWQDHMSSTFPTSAAPGQYLRQR